MKRIYALEDDPTIGELIAYTLNSAGFDIQVFLTPLELYQALDSRLPHVVLLDRMLSTNETGADVLKKLKNNQQTTHIPVIFLTSMSSEVDKAGGLDMGADDYIVKPFGVLELIARVKAILRRYDKTDTTQVKTTLTYKDLTINQGSKQVFKNGEAINLTFKEYALFSLLLENRGIVISRDTLLDKVWGIDFFGERRTVDVHIKGLRHKIGDNADDPMYIKTIRGYGYKLLKED